MAKKPGAGGLLDPTLNLNPVDAAGLDLRGKTVAVIGGTNGLGRAIARLAAAQGARVLVVGRSFRDEGTANLEHVPADLASMQEAQRVGRALPAEDLDLVVFTTGIIAAPKRETTAEGLERDMAVSYLSRLAILRELAPRLRKSTPPTRIFVMGFPGTGQAADLTDLDGARNYAAMTVHMNTVAGNEALVLDAVRRYPHAEFYGLNPGLIKTDIRANYMGEGSLKHRLVETILGWFTITPETYAKRILPVLVAPELTGRSGAMFNPKPKAILPSAVLDGAHVADLITRSEAMIAGVVSSPSTRPGRRA